MRVQRAVAVVLLSLGTGCGPAALRQAQGTLPTPEARWGLHLGAESPLARTYDGGAPLALESDADDPAEAFLAGKNWTRENIESAMPLIAKDFNPISDARGGSEFRRKAAANLLLKFWTETSD